MPTDPSPPPRSVPDGSAGPDAPAPPARPAAPVAGWLMIGGAVAMVIGSVLTWFRVPDRDVTGFSVLGGEIRDGPLFAVLAVVLAAFGLTTLLAGRLLPIAVLAVVLASFGLVAGLVDYGDVQDLVDLGAEAGPGLPVVIVGCLAALAGGIVGCLAGLSGGTVALATRRR